MLGWWSMPALQRDWRLGQALEGGHFLVQFLLHSGLDVNFREYPEAVIGKCLTRSLVHGLETLIRDNSIDCI